MIKMLIVVVTFVLSGSVLANVSYVCSQAGLERKISIIYKNIDAKVPCEVTYDKGEGSRVLWFADNEAGYCEFQAEQFIAKQENWGWDCAVVENSTDEPSMESSEPEMIEKAEETTE